VEEQEFLGIPHIFTMRFFWGVGKIDTPPFEILLMVQKSQTTTWDARKTVHDGINYRSLNWLTGQLQHLIDKPTSWVFSTMVFMVALSVLSLVIQ